MNPYKATSNTLYSLLLLFSTAIFPVNANPLWATENDTLKVVRKTPKQDAAKGVLANTPPVLTATGNQIYCPGNANKIVSSMSIVDPDDNSTLAVYIQISSGYVSSQDLLSLSGTHAGITSSWDSASGKLTIKSPAGTPVLYTDLIAAIEDVVYTNSSAAPSGTRNFSITIGEANYLPSTQHYYKFVPSLGITWSNAKTAAEASTYYELQGYLATITAADEAQLSGEQSAGAGWIGGSDAAEEGVWKWVTGPENGMVFWNGGSNGSSPNFAMWNSGEPNNAGSENYAHVTAPGVGITGSWNDLSNEGENSGNYQPKGYIVEYGGMPADPVLHISTSTTLTIPKITSTTDASRCGSGTVTLSAVSDAGTVKWYETAISTTPLATGNSFTTPSLNVTTTYYVDAFESGCTTASRQEVKAIINNIPVLSVISPAAACEGEITLEAATTDGDIRWFSDETGATLLATGTTYTVSNVTTDTTYYVDAINNGCISGPRVAVPVHIYPKPAVTDETTWICENGTVTLDAGISNVTYEWNPINGAATGATTRQITVQEAGIYTVEVTNPDGCSSIKTITVIEKPIPVIADILVDGNTVTITTVNSGDFEYSVDGTYYQNSPVFNVYTPGKNTAYVRETNDCGRAFKTFIMIIVPAFFTPNADSFNDTWTVKGMTAYPDPKVSIFDRQGRLITQLHNNNVWDGTFNNHALPADDYWFVLQIDEASPEVRGHFSLVR